MPNNKKQTSKNIATQASNTLKDPNASKTAKKLAASALAQANTQKQTGAEMEDFASMVLQSDKYNEETKSLAGSVLSQSKKER